MFLNLRKFTEASVVSQLNILFRQYSDIKFKTGQYEIVKCSPSNKHLGECIMMYYKNNKGESSKKNRMKSKIPSTMSIEVKPQKILRLMDLRFDCNGHRTTSDDKFNPDSNATKNTDVDFGCIKKNSVILPCNLDDSGTNIIDLSCDESATSVPSKFSLLPLL